MDLKQSVKAASLNKSTYINLRWIGILGQFITINTVKFIFGFEFNFILSNLIIFVGALSNFYLMFFYKKPILSNVTSFNCLRRFDLYSSFISKEETTSSLHW